ncbi:hypothetical protein LQT97_09805 [Brucella pseudogrignonensis]|uniref:hypothetical protein n=1 Tax=Brucella pseudogrignonensis TaxID=419475 RepID=UPI001E4610E6|nr:hypothetical protein [Brucella pseudogrignonensis]MCD4511532.1 hypothetical protein [Brucella pseudogrignonensis]
MSVGRIALRIATIEALRGNTSVNGNVLDSEIGSLDVAADESLRTNQEKPFISVYTDSAKADDLGSGRRLWVNGLTELLIETGIAASMTETNQETGEKTIIGGIPATDSAFELFLDVVDRETVAALMDPDNVWAEIWRGLVGNIAKVERRRTADAETGTRMAAHQQCILCDILPDPVYGAAILPTSLWQKLLDQMAIIDHPYLPSLRDLLGIDVVQLKSADQRRRFGITLDEARALCEIAPADLESVEPDIKVINVERSHG